MGTGVGDDIERIVVRQVRIVARAVEAELQHAHAGQAEGAAQLIDVGRDDAKILGDQRQLRMIGAQRAKQRVARRRFPVPFARGSGERGHRPVGRQSAKVIDPNQIEAPQLLREPRAPESEAIPLRLFPVVERIAPELPVGREIVRRHPGQQRRPARRHRGGTGAVATRSMTESGAT